MSQNAIKNSQDFADCASPDHVSLVLRRAADAFYVAQTECASAWQDKSAGRAWGRMAKVLERAAASCERIAQEG